MRVDLTKKNAYPFFFLVQACERTPATHLHQLGIQWAVGHYYDLFIMREQKSYPVSGWTERGKEIHMKALRQFALGSKEKTQAHWHLEVSGRQALLWCVTGERDTKWFMYCR